MFNTEEILENVSITKFKQIIALFKLNLYNQHALDPDSKLRSTTTMVEYKERICRSSKAAQSKIPRDLIMNVLFIIERSV